MERRVWQAGRVLLFRFFSQGLSNQRQEKQGFVSFSHHLEVLSVSQHALVPVGTAILLVVAG